MVVTFIANRESVPLDPQEEAHMSNVREEVTQLIIEAIKKGTPPWRKGWNANEPYRNAKTGAAYKGINQLLLAMSGYDDPRFLTLKQANELDCKVKKGETPMATQSAPLMATQTAPP